MAIRIEAVALSKNPVAVKESFTVSISIVTHGYLKKSTQAQLAAYTNGQLRLRGETVPTYAQLAVYRHSVLGSMNHQQIEAMEVQDGQ